MSSLLKDAKTYYPLFFTNNEWSEALTRDNFQNKWKSREDYDRRTGIIKEIYQIILNSSKTTPLIKKWIETPLSIQSVAELSGVNINTVKSNLYYFNMIIGRQLEYKGENLLKLCVTREEITQSEWQEIAGIRNSFLIKMGDKVYKNEKIFTSKNLLINIPKSGKPYAYEDISEEEFNAFIKLIAPYFTSVRSKNQKLINESRVTGTGYFQYLLTPHVTLREKDIKRREMILKLLDPATKKRLKDRLYQSTPKPLQPQSQEKISKAAKTTNPSISTAAGDDEIIDFGFDDMPGGYKFKRVQYDF